MLAIRFHRVPYVFLSISLFLAFRTSAVQTFRRGTIPDFPERARGAIEMPRTAPLERAPRFEYSAGLIRDPQKVLFPGTLFVPLPADVPRGERSFRPRRASWLITTIDIPLISPHRVTE